ncbi:MAG TPA: SH3 domain-containing protein [Chloroflexota bacterium]|nr:SH3 domain-containing protein [Chloroflexota bacterium]
MRKLAVILALAAYICGLGFGFSSASASQSLDNTSTGGVPFATSFIYPVGSPNSQPTWDSGNSNGYFITQGFNTSCDPSLNQGYYLYSTYFCGHTGVDLASSTASSVIHATAAGIVVAAGYNAGYGVMARIRHYLPDGSIMYSQYEHMAYGSLAVYTGEIVSQGQELGLVGATGFATGAHLHFEIKSVDEDGWGYTFGNASLIVGYVDPLPFVAAHQVQPASYLVTTGRGAQVFPAESEYILSQFLKSYQHYVTVSTSDGLHLRSGPGLHSPILGTALRGAKLGYVATKGNWIQVSLPQHVRGWVNVKYVAGYQNWDRVTKAGKGQWPPAGSLLATVDVTGIGLNVRSGPGQNHPVLSAIYQHDKVVLLSRTTSWARILTSDGTRGWVLRQYLDEPGLPVRIQAAYLVARVPLLNVRTGPGLSFATSGSVYSGTHMQLVRETPNWVAVVLPGGTTGWVARQFTSPLKVAARQVKHVVKLVVKPAINAASITTRKVTLSSSQVVYVTVKASILNIRSGPGQKHPVIAEVRQRTNLQVLALTTNWARVALPASTINGWVLRRYTR